jgi:hypothetical protein
MLDAVERLRRAGGKTLVPLPMEELGEVEKAIADNELLDPQRPEHLFEPIGKHGLARSWARGRSRIEARLKHRGRGAKG